MATIKENITEIKIGIARIDEHLKTLNSNVEKNTRHRSESCPTLHKEIDKTMYKSIGIFSVIVFIINIVVLFYINH